jgi:hypothetical protein
MKSESNESMSIICAHSHEDGLTNGKRYNVIKSNDWGYDIFPDDYGHLSGWDKRFFDQNSIISPSIKPTNNE